MDTASQLKAIGVNVFRAGIWKPRTHPGCYEGAGTKGLEWLRKVKEETGMKVCTEAASARHVQECLKAGIDCLWIGARTTANPFLVQEIAEALSGTDLPVLVKNPVSPDLDLWIGAFERLSRAGISRLGAIHRGFTVPEKIIYRNSPEWQVAIALRSRCPELPLFCDPSHMAGKRDYVESLSQKALDLGMEGLMVECHCNPSCALSDAGQQLTPEEFSGILGRLKVRETDSENLEYKESIASLRSRIDLIDEKLLTLLGERMEVSRLIGEAKMDSNITILQTSRWDAVLEKAIERGVTCGLTPDFVTDMFNLIHEESVRVQDDIISGGH